MAASHDVIISIGKSCGLPNCKQKEADTSVVFHISHAIQSRKKKIVIQTVDIDVIVILVHHFKNV